MRKAGRLKDEGWAGRPPLTELEAAFDELARRGPAFHARHAGGVDGPVRGWQVVAESGGFDAAAGSFTSPLRGHYLFMANGPNGARLWLRRNGEIAAQSLDEDTPLLVAALRLAAGDVVTLHAAEADGALCWRGARG